MGIAAIGFAFGHPQHSIIARPTSKKRKTSSRSVPREVQALPAMLSTPSPLPHSTSAPTSRLRKRSSAGRPLASANKLNSETKTLGPTPVRMLDKRTEDATSERATQSPEQDFNTPLAHGPFAFEFKGSENTPPTWLRRMSTLSSLKSGSPAPTDRPGSLSMAHSNGSTAPILPTSDGPSAVPMSRNKLVKRSSSQRALSGNAALHSSVRRPATSHQRSATFQQPTSKDEESARSSIGSPSILSTDLLDAHRSYDQYSQQWQPFFKPNSVISTKEGHPRKWSANGIAGRNETPKTIVPDISELPTLLLATSISSSSSSDLRTRRASNMSALSSPFTPFEPEGMFTPKRDKPYEEDEYTDSESRQRNSMSLSEIFPSPSPATWKMPRMGSLRGNKRFNKNTSGRRIASAPHSTSDQRLSGAVQSQGFRRGPHSRIHPEEDQRSPRAQQGSSSPLPQLNRLSAFEIDLPNNVPSYPSTPLPNNQSSPSQPLTHSSLSTTSPLIQSATKSRSYRFSSAPSEPASTLLGSDNDNSRLFSGDEDDVDARSETIYDSTRTGATGSSHSGIRRPPIDTIFDESPPPKAPSQAKLLALQDLLTNDVFDERDLIDHDLHVGEENDVSTPIRAIVASKEEGSPTPLHDTRDNMPGGETSSSANIAPFELNSHHDPLESSGPEQEDQLWAFDGPDRPHNDFSKGLEPTSNGYPNRPVGALRRPNTQQERRRESPPAGGLDQASKSNIFEWAESPSTDRDSSRGESPRPSTAHVRQMKDMRGSRMNGRRGPSALHLRSQSVPVPKDIANHHNNNPSKIDSWVLGNKGPSEDWDGDFEFDEASSTPKQTNISGESVCPSAMPGMLVPRAILERQASVHGQFGQVKELTLLVEELKRLQQQATSLGIMDGQSVELWKEAEGIINLATLDDEEQDFFPPRSPLSPSFDFDLFDDDSPSNRVRRKSGISQSKEERLKLVDDSSESQNSSRPSQEFYAAETPPSTRPRKESSAKAKSVLENIYQQRSHHDPTMLDAPLAQRKLPFDTTSLKDLVIRAGVVTRALKEIVRRADNNSDILELVPSTPPRDPPFISQMFHSPLASPVNTKSPRGMQSPKKSPSPKSQRSNSFLGGGISANDNEINGHMKMMTVV